MEMRAKMPPNGYHVPLGSTDWVMWDQGVLRSTGFPAARLAALSDRAIADSADGHLAGAVERAQFLDEYERAAARASRLLAEAAGDPWVLAAVGWQSADSLAGLRALGRGGPDGVRNNRRRRREKLASRYLQRYCAKTDTIGFFGPSVWVAVDPAEPGVAQQPGPAVVRRTAVRFEDWALDAFGTWLSREPGMLPWLPPARHPHHLLDGTVVLRPGRRPAAISRAEAVLMAACDGRRRARDVADAVLALHPALYPGRAAILDAMRSLRDRGLLTWDANLPIDRDAEQRLEALLNAIGDDEVRVRVCGAWARLTERRAAAAEAWGDATRLEPALSALDEEFEAITGVPARRRAGQMYAGRSLVYIEAQRDLGVVLGRSFIDRVTVPMDVVLRTARWLVGALRRRFEEHLADLVARLRTDGELTLHDLWYPVLASFDQDDPGIFTSTVDDFRDRWLRLIGPTNGPLVQLSGAELLSAVDEVFPPEAPGWSTSGLHAPDFQIGARSAAELATGAFSVVLGELHVALPTLCGAPFDWGSPSMSEVNDRVALEQGGRLVPALPRTWPNNTVRSAAGASRYDVSVAFAPAPGTDPERTLSVLAIRVLRTDAGLLGVLPDGTAHPLIDFFGHFLSGFASGIFKHIPGHGAFPRVVIDQMVVFRRSWALPLDLPRERADTEASNYLAVRRWKARHGLPERVFVKLASETKPFHVDFTSTVSVASLVAFVQAAATASSDVPVLRVSESLPELEEAPFEDCEANRYLGEVRLHITDATTI